MRKTILFSIISLLFFCNAIGQIKFEKGYFIDNSGKKTECFIKNEDWKNNPTTFEYRLGENSEIKKGTLNSTKEFCVPGQFKYTKYTVEIDRTVEHFDLGRLNYDPKPDYKTETLFLKVLIEGKASLFIYDGTILRKFFYSKENEIPQQLFYKRYKKSESQLASNNEYKQMLFVNLNCNDKTMQDEADLDYKKSDLIKYFEKYNTCENSEFVTLAKKNTKVNFNLSLKPRVNFSSLDVTNTSNNIRSANFGSQTNFSGGIEAEFVLDFSKGAWSLFIEPAYFSFKGEKEIQFQKVIIEHSFIELPIGVRRYFFIDAKSRIFLNAAYVYASDLKSEIEFEIPTTANREIVIRGRFGFGVGYNFNGRVSVEYRLYLGNKDIFSNSIYNSDFNYSSLILGYTLF